MSHSAGTKVTSSTDFKNESVGVVTSDSLAAESLQGDGSFGEGNPKAGVSGQPSKSTTTNTTDTAGATRLAPAVDAESRDAQQQWSETSQLNAGKSLSKTTSEQSNHAGNSTTSGSSGGASHSTSTGIIGGFAGADESARQPGELRPKGANLTETDDLQGKTVFGKVGTIQDPSRRAEQEFAKRGAQAVGDAGNTRDRSEQDGTSKFSVLGDEKA